MGIRTWVVIVLTVLATSGARADEADRFFENSYAVVVGIDIYENAAWSKLSYAESDAKAIARLLRDQGFQVTEILGKQATKTAILAALDDNLAPVLGENDRIVVFFAGHGTSRDIGGSEYGYFIPVDAGDSGSYSRFIALTALQELSATMAAAKHQLFILDSCFGGLASTRSGEKVMDPRTPNYLYEVSRRKARQLLTAGGRDQQVRDKGPGGRSYFVGELIKAVQDGLADLNGDGIVTFNELTAYIVPAATTYNQTPGVASMAGHQLGEFWLRSKAKPLTPAASLSQPSIDVYAQLRSGKQAFVASPPDYLRARQQFSLAAEAGNAEAMNFLGKLYWEGWGGPIDEAGATRWLESSAARGNIAAMESLIIIYEKSALNAERAISLRQALAEARRLEARITINDPSGQAARGDPGIPRADTVINRPNAPMNLTVR